MVMDDRTNTKPSPTVHTTSEVLMHHDPPAHHPLIYVWVVMIIIITGISGYLTYRNIQLQNTLDAPSSFIECTNAPGSLMQETFPPICVTRDGVQYTQPNTK